MLAGEGLLFGRKAVMGSHPVEGLMMAGLSQAALSLIKQPRMIGHLLVFEEDLDAIPQFVDLYLFADQLFRHGVAVRVDMDESPPDRPSV